MPEFITMLARGNGPEDMARSVLDALEKAHQEGWEPINFIPLGFKFVGTGDMRMAGLQDFKVVTTIQQIVFRPVRK